MSIERNKLRRSKLLSSQEDISIETDDIFSTVERVPKNYPDGKRFVLDLDGMKYFAVKIRGKVFKTASLSEG